MTSNYNNYSAAELEKALQSWVEPYPKPIILNHDLNTEPIGRVMAAKMDKEQDGSNFVRLQIAITDPVAAQKIMDKRYLTGSVGRTSWKSCLFNKWRRFGKRGIQWKTSYVKIQKRSSLQGKTSIHRHARHFF
jgi:hypothetical protein